MEPGVTVCLLWIVKLSGLASGMALGADEHLLIYLGSAGGQSSASSSPRLSLHLLLLLFVLLCFLLCPRFSLVSPHTLHQIVSDSSFLFSLSHIKGNKISGAFKFATSHHMTTDCVLILTWTLLCFNPETRFTLPPCFFLSLNFPLDLLNIIFPLNAHVVALIPIHEVYSILQYILYAACSDCSLKLYDAYAVKYLNPRHSFTQLHQMEILQMFCASFLHIPHNLAFHVSYTDQPQH